MSRIWTWLKHVGNQIPINDIGKFEYQNISFNVYGYENKRIFPLRITTIIAARHRVNLLHITPGKTSHYVLVKDLSRVVSIQYSNHNGKHYFCRYCLHGCTSEKVLKKHLGRCKLHRVKRIKFPEAENKNVCDKFKFTKTEYQLRLPFVIMQISKVFYLNKTHVSHHQQNASPSNTSDTYHAVMDDILKHPKLS